MGERKKTPKEEALDKEFEKQAITFFQVYDRNPMFFRRQQRVPELKIILRNIYNLARRDVLEELDEAKYEMDRQWAVLRENLKRGK